MLALTACVPITPCGQERGIIIPIDPAPPAPTKLEGNWLPVPAQIPPQPGFGVGVPADELSPEVAGLLGVSWYLTWAPFSWNAPPGVDFWPMVRVSQLDIWPSLGEIAQLAAEHPGATWIVGNEPDVECLQDDMPPRQYAMAYHSVYSAIKGADPTARVAIAGVAQSTELRLRYLDQVLDSYREFTGDPMPIDVWTLHAYVLNEQRDSWGSGIPAGFAEAAGELVEIDQHDDIELFKQRILRFRQWMAARGYRDCELAVTEYGILMPPDYGFDAERVSRFMWATFDYFQTATDPQVGLPSDGNRLVQRWAWFSSSFWQYPTSDLIDPATGQLTQVGHAFAEYVRTRVRNLD